MRYSKPSSSSDRERKRRYSGSSGWPARDSRASICTEVAGGLSLGISSGLMGEDARYAVVFARISSPMSIHISVLDSAPAATSA
jgi:hypothetical protein